MLPLKPEGNSGPREWLPVLVLAAASLLIRLRGLGDFWLNPDEGIFWGVATVRSLEGVWRAAQSEANPPLFYFLVRAMNAVSSEPAWLRLPSVAAGTLAVAVAYLLGKEVSGEPGTRAAWFGGLAAAAVLAFSPGGVTMSRVVRPYMVTVLLVTAALLFLARYERLRRVRDLFLHSVFLALALGTHYAAFVTLAGLAPVSTVLALEPGRRGLAGRLAAAHGLPGAVALVLLFGHLLPALLGSGMQEACVAGYLAPYMIGHPAEAWFLVTGTVGYLFGGGGMWFFLVVIVAGAAVAVKRRLVVAATVPAAVLLSAVVMSALEQYPMGCTRHAVHLLPVLALPVAAAVAGLARGGLKRAVPVLAALLLAVGLLKSVDPWRTMEKIQSGPLPEMVVSREGFQRARARLEKLVQRPGVLLMDDQTHLSFLPILRKEAHPATDPHPDLFERLEWGRRVVVISRAWHLQGDMGKAGAPPPLARFLDEAGHQYPDLPLHTGDVRVVYAGWGWPLIDSTRLAGILVGQRRVATGVVEGAGAGVFRLRADRYLAVVERLQRKIERERGETMPGAGNRG